MSSYLNKLILYFFGYEPDAKIIGDVKFYSNSTPYFSVKMKGCRLPVDITAYDISEKFTEKFHQKDIKKATKISAKYQNSAKLLSIEGPHAIIYKTADKSYQIIDIYNDNPAHCLNFDILEAADAFKLGVYFEQIRQIKNKTLMDTTRQSANVTSLFLVNADD